MLLLQTKIEFLVVSVLQAIISKAHCIPGRTNAYVPPPKLTKSNICIHYVTKQLITPMPQRNQKNTVVQNLMHQQKGPCRYMEINNKLAVTGEGMDREAAQDAHQASLNQKATPGIDSLT